MLTFGFAAAAVAIRDLVLQRGTWAHWPIGPLAHWPIGPGERISGEDQHSITVFIGGRDKDLLEGNQDTSHIASFQTSLEGP